MKKLQKSLFDEEERMEALLQMNDSLERLNKVKEWEKFRACIHWICAWIFEQILLLTRTHYAPQNANFAGLLPQVKKF